MPVPKARKTFNVGVDCVPFVKFCTAMAKKVNPGGDVTTEAKLLRFVMEVSQDGIHLGLFLVFHAPSTCLYG
jgi:hypothetical protein